MEPREKLRVLIPHWIEHNSEHAEEIRRWAGEAGAAGAEIAAAADALLRANELLATALDTLGGPLPQLPHDH